MFTGVVDRDGEETVRSLGGEMVDSVFECTHLVTDKVLNYSIYLIMTIAVSNSVCITLPPCSIICSTCHA